MNTKLIYLDNASTSMMDPQVLNAMLPYLKNYIGNASSTHYFGRNAKVAIEKARKSIANILSCEKNEIFFTSGGSESNNWIINSIIKRYEITDIITSSIEHKAILETVKQSRCNVQYTKLDHKGNIDYEDLDIKLQGSKKAFVSLMHINNEIGNINDIDKIGKLVKKYDHFFHSDCAQSIGVKNFNLKNQYIDSLSASSHKFHGPHGIGFLYLKNNYILDKMIYGGSQELNHRAGTENIPGIIGMTKALEIAYQNHDKNQKKIRTLKEHLIQLLKNEIPQIQFNGESENLEKSSNSIINITLPTNKPSDIILQIMDMNNICLSSGSACNSGVEENSYVIKELYKNNNPKNYLRISFSKFNSKDEIEKLVLNFKKAI